MKSYVGWVEAVAAKENRRVLRKFTKEFKQMAEETPEGVRQEDPTFCLWEDPEDAIKLYLLLIDRARVVPIFSLSERTFGFLGSILLN